MSLVSERWCINFDVRAERRQLCCACLAPVGGGRVGHVVHREVSGRRLLHGEAGLQERQMLVLGECGPVSLLQTHSGSDHVAHRMSNRCGVGVGTCHTYGKFSTDQQYGRVVLGPHT